MLAHVLHRHLNSHDGHSMNPTVRLKLMLRCKTYLYWGPNMLIEIDTNYHKTLGIMSSLCHCHYLELLLFYAFFTLSKLNNASYRCAKFFHLSITLFITPGQ